MQIGHVFINGGRLTELRQDYIKIEGSQVAIDVDGANGQNGQPPAYAPAGWGHTLDSLGDAGHPGNWWALVTDNGERTGEPVTQQAGDPCPGAYISMSSLHLRNADGSAREATDPFRYVDAATVPFLVVCPQVIEAVDPIVMGCRAVLTNTKNNISIEAVVADGGNTNEMGEISLAAAQALQIPGNAHGVNTSEHLLTMEIYPGVAAVVNSVTYPLQHS